MGHLAAVIDEKIKASEQRILAHLHRELRLRFYWLITLMAAITGVLLGAFTAVIKLT